MKYRSTRHAGVAAVAALAVGPLVVAASGTASAQAIVTSQSYVIGAGSVSSATVVAQPDTAGATADYTIGFVTPSQLVGGSATVTLSSASNGPVFPGSVADYFILDSTNNSSAQPAASVTLASGGHGVVLGLSSTIGAGDTLDVYVIGATNPASAGSYTLGVSTSASPSAAASASYQVVAANVVPTFNPTATPPEVGQTATYSIGAFKASAAVNAGGTIQVVSAGPAGTSDNVGFPTSAVAYKVEDATTGTTVPVISIVLGGAGGGQSGESVTLQLGAPVPAGDVLSVTATGVTNPSTAQADQISVSAPTGAAATTGTLAIGTPVTGTSLSLSSSAAGATGVEYSVGFRATSQLNAGGTIVVVAPSGTSFAGAGVTLVDSTHLGASASVPPGSVLVSTAPGATSANRLQVTVPSTISAGDQVFVEVSGVTNPGTGTYGGGVGDFTVATSADSVAAEVPSYGVGTGVVTSTGAKVSVTPTTPGTAAQYTVTDIKATAQLAPGATIELQAPAGTIFPSYVGDYTVADASTGAAGTPPATVTGGGTSDVTLTLATTVPGGDFLSVGVASVLNPPSGTYQMSVVGDLQAGVAPTSPPPPVAPSVSVALAATSASVTVGQQVVYTATVSSAPNGGVVVFTDNGSPLAGCTAQQVYSGRATCAVTYNQAGRHSVQAVFSGPSNAQARSGVYSETVSLPAAGYWLLTSSGRVFAEGGAGSHGQFTVTPATGAVVGIASTPSGKGYWVATSNGTVMAFGDAKSYGDLPSEHVTARDVTAIAPTSDGKGYWLVGRDGGMFTFGDAKFHGSVPGLHLHVRDVVGMVASPDGRGYLVVGADGGVFTFGSAHFYGSIPGLHRHVHDIRSILPSSTGKGYVLVGADSGAFVFGTGVHFLGSLPGRGIHVRDIVGLALTPDNGGYFMAGSNGSVYGFGDAVPSSSAPGLSTSLPVVAIAGT